MLVVDSHRLHSLCSRSVLAVSQAEEAAPAPTLLCQCLPLAALPFSYTTHDLSAILLHTLTASHQQCPPRGGQAAPPAHLPIATRDGTTNCHPARSRPLPQTSRTIPCIHDLAPSTLLKSLVKLAEPPEPNTHTQTTSINKASTMKQMPTLMAMLMATMRSLAASVVCKTTRARL